MKAKDIYAIREALAGLTDGICFHCDMSGDCKGVPCEKLQKAKAALALFPEFPVDEQPVNNAVILTALREIEDTATRCVNISEDAPDEMCEIAQRAKSALCFPPRNCDNAATWLDLYAHFHPPKGMREMPPEWVDAIAAFCQWLVATPKEGGAK